MQIFGIVSVHYHSPNVHIVLLVLAKFMLIVDVCVAHITSIYKLPCVYMNSC